ncbi:MAG: flavodoxin [Tissierellia bacterium]|nr:flavodoxin [Tissierellia bacterium]
MSRVAVVYWSGTGNTEEMAKAIFEGAKEAGSEASLFNCTDFYASMIEDYDILAFGCSSMGEEVLEEEEFEPMFASCESALKGKKIALFGSYGWGDGQWMRDWDDRCKGLGAEQVHEYLILNEYPDAAGLAACRRLGMTLV